MTDRPQPPYPDFLDQSRDIVARLREKADIIPDEHTFAEIDEASLLDEAADTIERLRNRTKEIQAAESKRLAKMEKTVAETQENFRHAQIWCEEQDAAGTEWWRGRMVRNYAIGELFVIIHDLWACINAPGVNDLQPETFEFCTKLHQRLHHDES